MALEQEFAQLSVQESEQLEELIECARYGELEELQQVTDKALLAKQGEYGKTPLHMAAANGHLEVVEYLISVVPAAALNLQNEQGNTALHWAATNGHAKVVEALITKGHVDYKIKNSADHSAMLEAEIHEREAVVAWMLMNTEPEEDTTQNDDEDEEESSEDDGEESDEVKAGPSENSSSK